MKWRVCIYSCLYKTCYSDKRTERDKPVQIDAFVADHSKASPEKKLLTGDVSVM